ncbi:MAG: hypothetical protein JWQ35_301 [Bacteriovoracaceae bacterium]|nr:hypothetical protein [Bacteriovoracaceae bacterium]
MTERNISCHEIIVRLGVFRALYASAVFFNSVLFRLIVGVLAISSGVPVDTVALVTLIEFSLNGILEVPFGILADRMGRVPSIALCLGTIMTGLTCVYIALLIHNDFSRVLFIIHGILIGLAKPFSSGSIEAFYQDALHRACQTEEEKKLLLTSLTTSQNHGKYYTTIAVLCAFVLAAIFNQMHLLPHTFLFGIILYAGCFVTLLRDYRQIGDIEKTLHPSSPFAIIKALVTDRSARISSIYNLSYWMISVVIAGYLIISLGREYEGDNFLRWAFMVSFMLGSAFGGAVKGHILPLLVHKLSRGKYLLTFYVLTLLSSLAFLPLYQHSNAVIQIIYIFVYGALLNTATSAIQNISMNDLMSLVKKQDYATALSFQNIPGYLWVGAYSTYLTLFRGGTPSVREAFVTVIVFSIIFSLTVIFVERDSFRSEIK